VTLIQNLSFQPYQIGYCFFFVQALYRDINSESILPTIAPVNLLAIFNPWYRDINSESILPTKRRVLILAWLISLSFDLIFNLAQRIVDFIVNVGTTILRRFGWQPTNSENQSSANVTDSENRPDGINSRTQPKANTASAELGFNPFQRK
jgi:hypothetical protein